MQLEYDQKIPAPQHLKITPFSSKYDVRNVVVKKLPSEGLSIKYSPDDQYIAIGCRNGSRLLYSVQQHKIVERYECISEISVTCVSDGNLNFWHVPSMKRIFNLTEENNSILCMDFNFTGEQFATAGRDCNIRIYDELTCKSAQWNNQGHDNRVFSVKFIDDHVLMSGGWDSVVHIWDVREGKSIKHFLGPHISGDSLDYQEGKILAGCYSAKNQVQIWNYSTCQKVEQIDWTGNIDDAEYIYTAGFTHHNPGMFAAGSTGKNSQVRLYEQNQNGKYKKVSSISGISQGCFSLDFGHKSEQFAFATAHHGLYVYEYGKK